MRTNLSLRGMRDYAESKKGIPKNNNSYESLRKLEELLYKMNDIRNGSSTDGCGSHGNEVSYGEIMTNCGGHSFIYNNSDLSLGNIRSVIDNLNSCSCDSFQKMFCDCNDKQIMCSCNTYY